MKRIDWSGINRAALAQGLVRFWLPHGRQVGGEWVARNPCRVDRKAGSFKVSLKTGAWCDFALADVKGRDLVSLYSYLNELPQGEAARRVAEEAGVPLGY